MSGITTFISPLWMNVLVSSEQTVIMYHGNERIGVVMMRLIVRGIEARRFLKEGETFPEVGIKNNSSVINMEKRNNELCIDFVFNSIYNPSIATIKIDGTLYYQGEDADEILEQWGASRSIPNVHIQNAIIEKGLMEAVILAKELNVVPPIPLPRIKEEEKKKVEEEFYHG